ncbi:hypothetical protein ACOZ4I_03630 [Haloarcula salina]|uniref:hypothetical protein n=1 Tax=Haloarcula salina TaxID=1429914 RepID=UPI003C6FA2E0
MRRRTFLAALALSPITGCVAPSGSTTTSSETPATSPTTTPESSATPTVTPPPDDPILFVVHNPTESDLTVSVTLTHDGTALIDETVALAADEAVEYDPGIHSPGEYTLTVAVDGRPTKTRKLPIDRFDVGAGSNHYVEIDADEIQIFAEE